MKLVIWNNPDTGVLAIGTPAYGGNRDDDALLAECVYRWHPDGIEGRDYHVVDSAIFETKDRANRSRWKLVDGRVSFS
jgi:hypothetical protein